LVLLKCGKKRKFGKNLSKWDLRGYFGRNKKDMVIVDTWEE